MTDNASATADVPLNEKASLSPHNAAIYTDIGYSTLKKMRARGTGPRYAKVGGAVIYLREDLDAWLRKQRRA